MFFVFYRRFICMKLYFYIKQIFNDYFLVISLLWSLILLCCHFILHWFHFYCFGFRSYNIDEDLKNSRLEFYYPWIIAFISLAVILIFFSLESLIALDAYYFREF